MRFQQSVLMSVLLILFTNCSNNDLEEDSTNSSNSSQNENLDNYLYKGCNGFVSFNEKDNSFLLYLRSIGVDTNGDTKISCAEANAVQQIDFGSKGTVTNLDGIEAFSNLKKISGAVQLQKQNSNNLPLLNLYNNSKLEEIDFDTYITVNQAVIAKGDIPIIVLPKESSLIKFSSRKTNISYVKNIEGQKKLKYLDLYETGIKGTMNLVNCNELIEIDFSRNKSLNEIKFSDKSNPNLIVFRAGRGDSGAFEGCNLKTINTTMFPNLEKLDVSANYIESIDVSKNLNLKYLSIGGNKLTSLNITNNKLLTYLFIGSNKIPNIDLSQNSLLEELQVQDNLITYLNISNLNNLFRIYCYNNLIKNLDFTSNKKLKYIYAYKNLLTSVNLKNGINKTMNTIDLTENKLSCILIDSGFTPPSTIKGEPYYGIESSRWYKDSSAKYCY